MAPEEDQNVLESVQYLVRDYLESHTHWTHRAVVSWHTFFVNEHFEIIASAISEAPWRLDVVDVNLLDSFEAWLMHDEGVAACGTYENYLVVACTILERYVNREFLVGRPHLEDGEDFRIAPLKKGQETLKVRFAGAFDKHSRGGTMRALHDLHYCANASSYTDALRHPALSRTTWEFAVQAHAGRTTEPANNHP